MRIPSSYTRNSNHMYPPRQVRFSFHYPLNMAAVKANAPEAPGVYEISLAEMKIDYPLCPSGVVYIGSAKTSGSDLEITCDRVRGTEIWRPSIAMEPFWGINIEASEPKKKGFANVSPWLTGRCRVAIG